MGCERSTPALLTSEIANESFLKIGVYLEIGSKESCFRFIGMQLSGK